MNMPRFLFDTRISFINNNYSNKILFCMGTNKGN